MRLLRLPHQKVTTPKKPASGQGAVLARRRSNNGFTLIELMVVIAIMGLLSSVLLVALNSARKKGRDARRLADLRQIATALDMYYDTYGQYPPNTDSDCIGWDTSNMNTANNPNAFIHPLVNSGILAASPNDPGKSTNTFGGPYFYVYYRYDPTSPYWLPGWSAPDSNYQRPFYVLALVNFETVTGRHPASPGWQCPGRDWSTMFTWVTGKTE